MPDTLPGRRGSMWVLWEIQSEGELCEKDNGKVNVLCLVKNMLLMRAEHSPNGL